VSAQIVEDLEDRDAGGGDTQTGAP
jgi:hypothetical protein